MQGIDVHVLVSASTPQEWVDGCLTSVQVAAERAGFPVGVHVLPGIDGHIGRGRAAGFACGEHPWVTFVDDDDWLEPDAFAVLKPHIEGDETWLCTAENTLGRDGVMRYRNWVHSMFVARRHAVASLPLETMPRHGDYIRMQVCQSRGRRLPQAVYNRREFGRSMHLKGP